MSAVDIKLLSWISGRMADLTNEGSFIRFDLYHAEVGGNAEKLKSVTLGDEGDDPADIAALFWDIAEDDASTRSPGVPQRYSVLGFRSETGTEPDERKSFNLHSPSNSIFNGNTETPDPKGVIAASLRQNENMHRLMVAMTEATSGRLASEVKRLDDENQKLRDGQLSTFELVQDLQDRKLERGLAQSEAEAKAKRMDDLLDLGKILIPVVLAKLVPGTPAATSAVGSGVKNLLMGMKEAEFEGVLNALSPANKMALINMYETAKQETMAEDVKKPELFQKYPDENGFVIQ